MSFALLGFIKGLAIVGIFFLVMFSIQEYESKRKKEVGLFFALTSAFAAVFLAYFLLF